MKAPRLTDKERLDKVIRYCGLTFPAYHPQQYLGVLRPARNRREIDAAIFAYESSPGFKDIERSRIEGEKTVREIQREIRREKEKRREY